MTTQNGGAACSDAPAPSCDRPTPRDTTILPHRHECRGSARSMPEPVRLVLDAAGLAAMLVLPYVAMLAGTRGTEAVVGLLGGTA